MTKITSTFLKELNDSIVWMSAPHLRAWKYNEGSAKPEPFDLCDCVGLRYASNVVLLKDNLVAGYVKVKKAKEILARLDKSFEEYLAYQHLGPDASKKKAIDALHEIQKDIDLVF